VPHLGEHGEVDDAEDGQEDHLVTEGGAEAGFLGKRYNMKLDWVYLRGQYLHQCHRRKRQME
jgi:hypothetical protein